jgi:hypothetical protein
MIAEYRKKHFIVRRKAIMTSENHKSGTIVVLKRLIIGKKLIKKNSMLLLIYKLMNHSSGRTNRIDTDCFEDHETQIATLIKPVDNARDHFLIRTDQR